MSSRNFLNLIKKALPFLVILVLLVLIKNIIISIYETKNGGKMFESLKEELASKKRERAHLSQKLYFAKTDQFVEEQARSKLGLSKEGERVIIDKKISREKRVEVVMDTSSNWQKWWRLFF